MGEAFHDLALIARHQPYKFSISARRYFNWEKIGTFAH
jgi:hypothetical protein